MHTFKKAERLNSKILIEKLFQGANSFQSFPFKVLWLVNEKDEVDSSAQILISVPKKKFKSAVQRNKIRRRIKEAYRKKKAELYKFLKTKNRNIALILIYIAPNEIEYKEIEEKINVTLERLEKEIEKTN